jgi:putative ABC transport system permease protein
MLKLKNIVKHYITSGAKVEALRGINLEFRKNEFVSILGPSGCGKTTMLNIIGGLDRYTSGDLFINGRSTKDFNDQDWDSYRNHSIGFVFQNYNLIPHLNILGNVELALTLSGISIGERRKRAVEALTSVGLADQIHKKPNQLSGGQMQRVAIARALVNNPDILLADEPTGALDTKTSEQIMELLKGIAKDRLVIMVTHNSAIADKYSTRIIKLLDGQVIEDSNPYTSEEQAVAPKTKKSQKGFKKTSMSFFTALSLSLRNLATKKTRTFLTSFAGSIGIIGIAIVLALSNGFQTYIDHMQADTLTAYPIQISQSAIDFTALQNTNVQPDLKQFTSEQKVFVNKVFGNMQNLYIKNTITDKYITEAIETIDPSLYNAISYGVNVNLNIYQETKVNDVTTYASLSSTSSWQEMMNNDSFINSQYDVIKGKMPSDENEIALVVDSYNRITDIQLKNLGLYDLSSDVTSIDFDDLIGYKYKLILNDDLYTFNGTRFVKNSVDASIYSKGVTLEIVGILRNKENITFGALTSSVVYTPELTSFVLDNAQKSEIVLWQTKEENRKIDAETGEMFKLNTTNPTYEAAYESKLRALGGITTPSQINIYPKDFKSKELIKKHLDDYNALQENDADKVYYSDVVEVLIGTINTVIDVISYILIAFTAISLVVSSIMIGIITYISVLERTKEIGILRSIGARKKDISRVFNAETIIIGFISGLIGVVFTLILTIPINIILVRLVDINGLANLKPIHGLMLVIISMTLTLIAGLIPSRIAAKKDPVIALRSE